MIKLKQIIFCCCTFTSKACRNDARTSGHTRTVTSALKRGRWESSTWSANKIPRVFTGVTSTSSLEEELSKLMEASTLSKTLSNERFISQQEAQQNKSKTISAKQERKYNNGSQIHLE